MRREQLRREPRQSGISGCGGGDRVRYRGEAAGRLQEIKRSNTVSVVTESFEVLHKLVKTRSNWFPAWWVGGDRDSVRSNLEKKLMNSDDCSFSGRSLRTTSGVPLSGEQLRRVSISSKKSQRGETMWNSNADVGRWSRGRTWWDYVGEMRSPVPPPRPRECENE